MRGRLTRLVPGLVVSAGFTMWFIARAEWNAVGTALVGVKPVWVLASAAVLFTEFIIRAVRWKVLLQPIAPHARLSRLFVATVIGMSLNVALPFRAGDIARPWLGSRETGTDMAPLVTIAIIERVLDILGLVTILMLMSLLLTGTSSDALIGQLQGWGAAFGLCAGLGFAVFLWMAFHEHRTRALYTQITRRMGPVGNKFQSLFDGFTIGLAGIRDRSLLAQAAGLSVLHWFNGALSIFLLFHAFSIDLPFAAACFTTVGLALTVALPQAPGFFGVFHFAIENALRIWGMDPAPAQAFAIILWAVSFIPVSFLGALFWMREGMRFGDMHKQPGK